MPLPATSLSSRRFAAPLRYSAIALAVAAIAWPAEPVKVRAGLSGSEWRVVEIGGQQASGAGTLRFTLTSIRGRAPCNSFIGAFHELTGAADTNTGPTQAGGAIEIAGLGASPTICGRMDLERLFLDALASARSYIVEGATLVLLDGAGRKLVKLAG